MEVTGSKSLKTPDLASATFKPLDDVNVRTSKDKKRCWITGATVVSAGRLLLADNYNESVKLVDSTSNAILATLNMSSPPWDVGLLPNNQAAVTVPSEGKVYIISTTEPLAHVCSFSVDGGCWGIALTNDKLSICICNPEQVQIVARNGCVLQSIVFANNGESLPSLQQYFDITREVEIDCENPDPKQKVGHHLGVLQTCAPCISTETAFDCPDYVSMTRECEIASESPDQMQGDGHDTVPQTITSANTGNPCSTFPQYVAITKEEENEVIYVSDRDTNSVMKLSMTGQVLLTYTDNDLNHPEGLAVTSDGELLVCTQSPDQVLLLSPNGQVKSLSKGLDGLYLPYSICVCSDENKIYIGNNSDSISVYQIKSIK